MDGKYSIVLNTPMGNERGIILFRTKDNELSGVISAKGGNNPFYGGRISGNKFQFSGEMNILMMRIQYTATGRVEGGKLTGIVRTRYGDFAVNGNRI
ncbi:hypothetical protein [Clostridium sp. LP20]|uniref:hypothetical protein n=1 Tax=Clostridium sp. LP20 TaxID=3418665 RepID=UPI003EE50999